MPDVQPKSHTGLWVTIVVILSVLFFAATGLAVWQFLAEPKTQVGPTSGETKLQNEVSRLTEENKQLDEDLADARKRAREDQDQTKENSVSIAELPVIVYERAGLLSESELDQVSDEFLQKVFEPMAAYALDQGHVLLTVNVEIPEAEGDDYIYSAIYDDGVSEGALYGKRGETLDWWVPACLDECDFTDEFKDNFPDVIDAYEGTL